jgi:hypothetical protein
MSYQLNKNIIATITYYDVLDMPLSAFEIWKHLIAQGSLQKELEQQCELSDVFKLLASGMLADKIDKQNGFYFLRGRGSLVARRIRMEKISVGKLKRMRSLARVLAYIPYLRLLGATGSLAMKNGVRASDWDMFVVLRSGKIWMGRTLLTGFLHSVGKRRYQNKIQDRVCLNYFVTDDNLEIGTKDLFSAHEYNFFIPLLNFHLFQIFELKNRWIQKYCPNFAPTTLSSLWTLQASVSARYVQKKLENFFDLLNLERWLAHWQRAKILRNPKTLIEGSLIEASDRALIFLPYPRGPRVFQKFKERLSISLPQDSGSL